MSNLTCASLCSISCSCCRALTKAVFNLFVCSAFNAFFTLFVTHCSQITDFVPVRNISLETKKKFKQNYTILAFIFLAGLPFPDGSEVGLTLTTGERSGRQWSSGFFGEEINYMLQTHQIDELCVAGVRDEMHFWRGWFRRWNLNKSKKTCYNYQMCNSK